MDVSEETIIFADSGGFHFDEKKVDTTPAETLETQRQIGADIFGTVDVPILRENRQAENNRRISQSIEYALDASEQHDGNQLLFASVHGYDPETVRNSIQHLEKNGDFDGYAIGSLVPIRTEYEKVTKIILSARLATDKHIHVYGLGGVTYQPLLLYLGVDSFDSSAFVRSAGNRNYLIPGFGGEPMNNFEELSYLPCACPICNSRSFDEVRVDRDLLVQHNLWALALELRRFKFMAATDADLEEYLELRFRNNPVTKRAFRLAKQQVRRLK
jgi:tRNA-guanine family transglycosylase